MFGLKYFKNISTLKLDTELCNGCQSCLDVCPHNVFEVENKKVNIIDSDLCMECGACAKNCPENAIDVDSGVGCAAAIIKGKLTGTEPTCGCSDGDSNSQSCC